MASSGAERQRRYRKRRRERVLVLDPAVGDYVNPEPHEGSDTEYKAGCRCLACRPAHARAVALGRELARVGDLATGEIPLAMVLSITDLGRLARRHLGPVPTVPPPPPLARAATAARGGRHRRERRPAAS